MSFDQGVRASLVRTLGFVRKELLSVFRQPRLLLTLVIGPFLILLLFGLGYRENTPPFRTLLVVGEDSGLVTDGEDLSEAFGNNIDLQGTITDVEEARRRLREGETDLLIIAPSDPIAVLDSEQPAVFEVVHGEVDPVLQSTIDLIARLSIDELNRRALEGVVEAALQESEEIAGPLAAARESSSRLVAALESGDRQSADAEMARLRDELERTQSQARELPDQAVFDRIAEQIEAIDSADGEHSALEDARALEATLAEADAQLTRVQETDPAVLVRPFEITVGQLNDVPATPGVFYSPGTLALLVQHLALTFAALSLVRERQIGITEVFRVSPLGSGEALVGKYLGFGVIAALVAVVLSAAMVAFGVQIRGSVLTYVLVVVMLIIASLGMGFILSAFARTDSQAVQYAMIALLVSIFFTGFVLPLERLTPAVHVVSYLIPATYAINAIHDVVFRGSEVSPIILAGLIAYALVLGAGGWWAVRREVNALPS